MLLQHSRGCKRCVSESANGQHSEQIPPVWGSKPKPAEFPELAAKPALAGHSTQNISLSATVMLPPLFGCFDAKNHVGLPLHTATMSQRFFGTQSEISVD
jgi:hypothetical protein